MRIILYIVIFISYLLLFSFVEIIKRKSRYSSEITRKLLHIFSGMGAIFWSGYLSKNEFIFITSVFLVIFIINYKKKLLRSLQITNRRTFGEITYLLGLMVYAFLLYSQRNYFVFGILVLMIPDAAAGLINHFLKKPYKEVFHISSYAILTFSIIIIFLPLHFTILFALILTIVEYYSSYGLDNLTIPLVFSLLIKLIL